MTSLFTTFASHQERVDLDDFLSLFIQSSPGSEGSCVVRRARFLASQGLASGESTVNLLYVFQVCCVLCECTGYPYPGRPDPLAITLIADKTRSKTDIMRAVFTSSGAIRRHYVTKGVTCKSQKRRELCPRRMVLYPPCHLGTYISEPSAVRFRIQYTGSTVHA